MNAPGPAPSTVLLPEIVGFAELLQHTPLAVTVDPLRFVILPPDVAVVEVIEFIGAVVRIGMPTVVVKEISFPYAVPPALIA